MARALTEPLVKDPDSTEPVGLDWTAYLEELGTGVQILTSTWAVAPSGGVTAVAPTVLTGRLQTQAFLQGGALGTRYVVTNRIITNSTTAVIDDRSFDVLIQER